MELKPKIRRTKSGEFFPRKVARSGNARYVAVTRILPKDWEMVKLSVVKLEGDICILRLQRLI